MHDVRVDLNINNMIHIVTVFTTKTHVRCLPASLLDHFAIFSKVLWFGVSKTIHSENHLNKMRMAHQVTHYFVDRIILTVGIQKLCMQAIFSSSKKKVNVVL